MKVQGNTLNGKVENVYSLTPLQEGMLFYNEMDKGSSNYILQSVYTLSERVEEATLRLSFKLLSKRYEACRMMVISKKTTKPFLVVVKDREIAFEKYDFSHFNETEQQEKLEKLKKDDVKRGFDLQRDPLMRISYVELGNNQRIMIWCMHHIIIDGWCNAIILGSLFRYYEALEQGRGYEELEKEVKWEAELDPRYGEYAKWIEGKDKTEALHFFHRLCIDYDGVAGITPLQKPEPSEEQVAKLDVSMPMSVIDEIRNRIGDRSVTTSTIVQTAWGILLSQFNHTKDVIFGKVVSGRSAPIRNIENMVGLFINTIPMRIKYEQTTTWKELLIDVQRQCSEEAEYEYCSLAEIQKQTNVKNQLFQTLFAYENYYVDTSLLETAKQEPLFLLQSIREQTNYPITVTANAGNETLNLSIMYNPSEFCREQIKDILQKLMHLLFQVRDNIHQPVHAVELATKEEKETILHTFNDSYMEFEYEEQSFTDLFAKKMEEHKECTALVWQDKKLTYAEFQEKVYRLAAYLQNQGVGKGDFVAIVAERSMEMLIGIYAIIQAGAAYVPIDKEYPKDRIAYILKDCKSKVALTYHTEVDTDIPVIALEEQVEPVELELLPVENEEDRIISCIYTSGTTGKPKGVMNYERGLLNIICFLQSQYPLTEQDVILQKTSLCFDVSESEIFWFFITGATLVLPEPGAEKDPVRLSEVIKKYGVTVVNFAPSMLQLFLSTVKGNNTSLQNLKTLRYVIAAGEALGCDTAELLYEQVKSVNKDVLLVNAYGPTEASIYSTYYECRSGMEKMLIGKPVGNSQIYILAKDKLAGIGIPGELCIAGQGVAKGYLNLPELTAERFVKNPFGTGTMYRSGDLARWMPDGNIEYLGRMDQQVKIRGFRIELGEIESNIRRQDGIQNCVVVVAEDHVLEPILCAYIEAEETVDTKQIQQELRRILPDYMIPTYILQIDRIPLNQNGKLNRKALPMPFLNHSKEYVAPRTEVEELLCTIFQEVLGQEKVGVQDDFFELGGHSLRATRLLNAIEAKTGNRPALHTIFTDRTVEMIAKRIEEMKRADYEPIPVAEEKEYYPMSSVQKRMYLVSQMDTQGILYNMAQGIEVSGTISREAAQYALDELIRRHEILRTAFLMVEGEPVQKILPVRKIEVLYEEDTDRTQEELLQQFIQPFDLSSGILVRVKIVKRREHSLLLFDLHHIICDGMSIGLFIHEFMALYNGKSIKQEVRQYKDYSEWMCKKDFSVQKEFWCSMYEGEIPILDFPTDKKRPSERSYRGSMVHLSSGEPLHAAVKKLALQTETTEYMVLLSGLMVLLAKYSGQEDIIIGSPVNGRTHPDTENMLGMFVNTLALRGKPEKAKTFAAFLKEMKEICLKAYEHQEYPFEELITQIVLKEDMSRNPLFDVMFVLQNNESIEFRLQETQVEGAVAESTVAKFDLTFNVVEANGQYYFDLEYSADIFQEESMKWLLAHYVNVLLQAANAPETCIGQLEVVGIEEKEQILHEWNHEVIQGNNTSITQLFLQQVELAKDQIAVIYQNEELTYEELARRAGVVAARLRRMGIKREDRVALLTKRSTEMVVAIYGVFLAGAAYVPIETSYPEERIGYMLTDSDAKAVITFGSSYVSTIPTLVLDNETWEGESVLENSNEATDLAYIIYTSGSTGKPKGVMIEHQGVCNLIQYFRTELSIGQEDRVLLFANYVFDGSVWEMMMALSARAVLVIPEEEVIREPKKMKEYLAENGVTISYFPPAYFRQSDFVLSKYVITAGSASGNDIVEKAVRTSAYINSYGPTEVTVCATNWCCEKEGKVPKNIPIGRPIGNKCVYIMDGMQLCGIGMPGEICVGGVGIARGYLNEEALTGEKFGKNPYAEGRWYHTGDQGRWLPDGNIEYLGRTDEQVKVRGYRIETGEIESAMKQIPNVQDSVVVVREDNNQEQYICAYFTAERTIEQKNIRAKLETILPAYMIPSRIMQIANIPVTQNGKVDKKALPFIEQECREAYIAPRNEKERAICESFSDALNIQSVGVKTNFFEAGGDSIKAMRVVSKMRELGYEITIKDIMQRKTPEDIAGTVMIIGGEYADYEMVTGLVNNTPIIKEFLQEWKLKNPSHFNQAMAFVISVQDEPYIQPTLEILVEHHDILRSVLRDGKLFILPYASGTHYSFQCADGREEEDYAAWAEIICTRIQESINLTEGPLMKVVLFHSKQESYVFVCMHHLIVDGVSWRIFGEDFYHVLEQLREQRPAKLQGKTTSFQTWADELAVYKKEMSQKERRYWDQITTNLVNFCMEQGVEEGSSTVHMTLSESDTNNLLTVANRAYHTKINDLLLSSLGIAVRKLTGQEKIAVMLESHGRTVLGHKVKLDRTMGWFTCFYPVVLTSQKTERESIIATKETLRDIPKDGIGYGLCHESRNKTEVALYFNYLGEMGEKSAVKYPLGKSIAPENKLPGAVQFNGFVADKKLYFSITGDHQTISRENLKMFAKYYKESLCEVIDHCTRKQTSEKTKSDYSAVCIENADFDSMQALYHDIEDIYTLSPLQEGMLFHHMQKKSSTEYVLQSVYRIEGSFSMEHMKEAANLLAVHYPVLRTTFADPKQVSVPLQVVHKEQTIEFIQTTLMELEDSQQEEAARNIVEKDVLRGFELTKDSLMRIQCIQYKEETYDLVITAHHIIVDGWSQSYLLGALLSYYVQLCQGTPKEELYKTALIQNQSRTQFSHYINWLKQQDIDGAMTYWSNLLDRYEESADIPPVRTPKATDSQMERRCYAVSKELTRKLQQIAVQSDVTINTITEAVWGILLHKYNHIEDAVFGKVVSGRNAQIEGIETMVGLFINTIPVRVQVKESATFIKVFQEIQLQSNESSNYEYCSLAEIQSACGIGENLIKTLFVFENYYVENDSGKEEVKESIPFSIEMKQVREQTNYALTVSVNVTEDQMNWNLMYNPNTYQKEDMDALYARIELLLRQIAETPEKKVAEVEFVLDAEKEKILYQFNRKIVPFHQTVLECFEEQVKEVPNHTAVSYQGEEISYKELNERAEKVAAILQQSGVEQGETVAFITEQGIDTIVWIVGIVKNGCVYVAIDKEYPLDRIQFMLEDSNARILFTKDQYDVDVEQMNPLEYQDLSVTYCKKNIKPEDLLYFIYTSGTTGKPKASMIEHKSVIRLVRDRQCYQMSAQTIMLQSGTMAFDAFTIELWGPLLHGGRLVLSDKSILLEPQKLKECIQNYKVNTMWMTARLYNQMITANSHIFDTLIYLLIGGEKLSEDHVRKLKKVNQHTILINGYGPTENTTFTTLYEIPDDFTTIPIGKPVLNTQVYILNHQSLCGIGMIGELCTSGEGVARGYHNNTALTEEKFIVNPFTANSLEAGKLYRTGDLARWNLDGNIEYCGRMDDQIKLRGYRIELGEIETAFRKLKGVVDAVVVVNTSKTGNMELNAYFVSEQKEVDIKGIRSQLATYLPAYMLPNYIKQIEAIPISKNGKLEKSALPKIEKRWGSEYAEPRNENEEKLCHIFGEILDAEPFGIDDNIFELGANSIVIMQIVGRCVSEGIHMTIQNIFEHPTIRQLSEYKNAGYAYQELITSEEHARIQQMLAGNVMENNAEIYVRDIGNVLVTGATGFLGIHVVARLLEEKAEKVYCLVRCESVEHGYERMEKLLHYYFENRYDSELRKRMVVISGDLVESDLDTILPKDIHTVIHTAAHTKHYGFYEDFYKINVVGTEHVVKYAKKNKISLTHISTMSICAMMDAKAEDTTFSEHEFYKKQVITDSPYALTKFLAEKVVLTAICDGLDGVVIRVGNLTNRYRDLKGMLDYKNNRFNNQLKTMLRIGNLSNNVLESTLEFSPIDEVAEGVVRLTKHRAANHTVFHLHASEFVPYTMILEAFDKIGIQVNKDKELRDYMDSHTDSRVKNEIFAFLAAFAYESEVQGIQSTNAFTLDYLAKIAFYFEPLGAGYIDAWVKYYDELGYWNI